MEQQFSLDEHFARPGLSIRARTPVEGLPQVLGRAYGQIAEYLGRLGEHPAGPPYCAYHNMDMADLEISAGFAVGRALPGEGEIEAAQLPARAATCLHVGPYTELRATYDALLGWVQANGHAPTGVAYEFYLDDPTETPPQALRTLVAFALS